jgi:hypothetical protein
MVRVSSKLDGMAYFFAPLLLEGQVVENLYWCYLVPYLNGDPLHVAT